MRAIYESVQHERLSPVPLSFLAGAGSVFVLWSVCEWRRRCRSSSSDLSFLSSSSSSSPWWKYLQSTSSNQDVDVVDAMNKNNNEMPDTSKCIYLDYNGTTPIDPHVLQAMMPYLTVHFGNPSSGHVYGQAPAAAMTRARIQVLSLLGRPQTDPSSIWFTACGTEADNMAIKCALQANAHLNTWNKDNGHLPHIVTSNIEHPAIEAYLQHLEQSQVCTVTYVPVQPDGRVRAADVTAACRPQQTILVTLMWANNETGALQPVAEVAKYCRQAGILIHTDAAQAAGKVSVDLTDALGNADMVTLVGHKLGAPKGVACLYVRPHCLEEAGRQMPEGGILLHGGGQEFGRRAGTPNVPYIVAMGHAAAMAARDWPRKAQHMAAVRAYLLDQLQELLGTLNVKVHGPAEAYQRLPNTLSVGLRHVHAGQLLQAVSHQVAASAGATCHANDQISSVLRAMHIPTDWARGTLRLSVGPTTSFDDVQRAAQILAKQVQILQQQQQQQQQ